MSTAKQNKMLLAAIAAMSKKKGRPVRQRKVTATLATAKPKRKTKSTALMAKQSGWAQALGSAVGSIYGPIGTKIGASAGSMFSKITGYGDYSVQSNSIVNGTDPPTFATNGRGTIVRHREYLGDISGSTAFNLAAYPLNPGLASTFPWLSQIAANFEQYVMRGCVFEIKTISSDALNSTNTALGSVILSTSYNPLNPNFASKAQMDNYEFTTSAKPSVSFMHPIECAVGERPLQVMYTRSGPIPSTTVADLRFYDIGTTQVATVGMQASAVTSELWVTYDVELLKPKINVQPSGLGGGAMDHYRLNATTVTSATPLGGAVSPALAQNSNLGTTVIASANQLVFPISILPQQYMVTYISRCATSYMVTGQLGIVPGSNMGLSLNMIGDTLNQYRTQPSGPVFDTYTVFWADIGAGGTIASNTVTFGTSGTFGTVSGADLFIVAVTPLVVSAVMPMAALSTRTRVLEDKSESKSERKEDDDEDDEAVAMAEYQAYMRFKKTQAAVSRVDEPDYESLPVSVATPRPKGSIK